jgi:hypothetical protein
LGESHYLCNISNSDIVIKENIQKDKRELGKIKNPEIKYMNLGYLTGS